MVDECMWFENIMLVVLREERESEMVLWLWRERIDSIVKFGGERREERKGAIGRREKKIEGLMTFHNRKCTQDTNVNR